jgi:hypothetical protein
LRSILALGIALILLLPADGKAAVKTFMLSWQDNSSDEDGFRIYRDGVLIGTIGADITTYSDSASGNEGQQFCYQVSAFNAAGESAKTDPVCGTIPFSTVPIAPSTIVALASDTSISLSWHDNSGNEEYFEIEFTRQKPPAMNLLRTGSNITSYLFTGLKKNTQYQIRLRAGNAAGVSPWSQSLAVITSR